MLANSRSCGVFIDEVSFVLTLKMLSMCRGALGNMDLKICINVPLYSDLQSQIITLIAMRFALPCGYILSIEWILFRLSHESSRENYIKSRRPCLCKRKECLHDINVTSKYTQINLLLILLYF